MTRPRQVVAPLSALPLPLPLAGWAHAAAWKTEKGTCTWPRWRWSWRRARTRP